MKTIIIFVIFSLIAIVIISGAIVFAWIKIYGKEKESNDEFSELDKYKSSINYSEDNFNEEKPCGAISKDKKPCDYTHKFSCHCCDFSIN